MSGGSYDYLYSKEPEDLLNRTGDLERMRDRLIGLDHVAAAKAVEALRLTVVESRVRIGVAMERIAPVMKAVEWLDSCDSGPEEVERAVKAWSQK